MREPEPIGYHVVCRLEDNRVIAPTHEERQHVARIVLERFQSHRLLACNVPDTHLHLEHLESHAVGAELTRRVQIAIRRRLRIPVRFARPFPKPVRSQGHLFKAFDYIMRQQPHHGLDWDPYRAGSNLPDLLGLRVLGQRTANHVRQYLPRVDRGLLLGYLGVDRLDEADGPLEQLLAATLAASGVTTLRGKTRQVVAARRAAVEVVGGRLTQEQTARQLGVDRKTLWRARNMDPDARLVRAIRLQLGLRSQVNGAPAGPYTEEGNRAA